jgi:hypothetical protein
MWDHFSVGCPGLMKENTWNDHGNPLRGPTWAYKWDVVSEFTSDPQRMYEQYVNEFNTLTPDQVIIATLPSLK